MFVYHYLIDYATNLYLLNDVGFTGSDYMERILSLNLFCVVMSLGFMVCFCL